VSRIFLSHSSSDSRQAVALKLWLSQQRPELANEIFLDIDPQSGLRVGEQWKGQLFRTNSRCESIICLLSAHWLASSECKTEYRTAEGLGKRILVARIEDVGDTDITSEWQRCELFADGAQTEIAVAGGPPVRFSSAALLQLRRAIEGSGVGPQNFVWPPSEDPGRAPYRGWVPFEDIDAGVFFGRDAAIARGLDELRATRFSLLAQLSGLKSLFVVLGPSGSGKSSFLRAGLIPRLQREDRRFVVLGIVRPERNALTGKHGLAAAIDAGRQALGLPGAPLGDIKKACLEDDLDRVYDLLVQVRAAAAQQLSETGEDSDAVPVAATDPGQQNASPNGRSTDAVQEGSAPTLVLGLDQAEELFSADAGQQAEQFLTLLAKLLGRINATELGLVVAATIRTDRFEVMQNHPALAGIGTVLFDELKPMPDSEFKEVIVGPAERATEAGYPLSIAPDLVSRLLADAAEGADTLPLLALTLTRLHTDYASAGELTLANYESMGGMRDVVNNEIDEILGHDPHQRHKALASLRSAFIPWLATINPDNDQPMRRVARESDLPVASRPLIDALVDKRLLVRDERGGQVVVEVALESLLRQWDELAGWLREERQNLKTADDIERSAAAWETQGRDPAWLLTGTRLSDAELLSGTTGFKDRLETTRDYLGACRQAEDERVAAEEAQRQAELRYAQELTRNAEERQQTAEAHAVVLRRRSTVLRRVLVATAVVAVIAVLGAVVAVVGFRQATAAKLQAQERYRQAVALRLGTDAEATLAGTNAGGDIKAIPEAVGVEAIAPGAGAGPMFDALVNRSSTVKILTGHTGGVNSVAFTPDGHRLASAGADNTIRLWDPDTGQQIGAPLTVPADPDNPARYAGGMSSVAFSPDGHRLASAGDDRAIRLWNADSGQQIGPSLMGSTRYNIRVSSVAFSPDGHRLASGGDDGIRFWDPDTGQPLGPPSNNGGVVSLAFSPDGHRLASGGDINDKTARLWDVDTGQQIGAPLTGHPGAVSGVAFSPDGRRLATCGGSFDDKTIRLWNADTGQPIGAPLIDDSAPTSVAFSPDGHRLASGRFKGTPRLWDADTGQRLGGPLDGQPGGVSQVVFSPDGHRLASAGDDGTVRLWNVTGQQIGTPLTGHTGVVSSVAFSPEGHRLASAGWDKRIRLWNADTRQQIGVLVTEPPVGVNSVAFNPDGHRLAAGGDDDTVRLWNADTGQQIGDPLGGHTGSVQGVAFSPDGHRLASASYDNTIRLWNADTGQQIGASLTGHHGAVNGVAFSSNGHWLASAGEDKTVRLWNADTGQQIGAPLTGHTQKVVGVAISPDGHRLASASDDNTIRLWNADTGQQIGAPLTGHTVGATSVAFSPDGHQLASGGKDNEVRLWNADTGQPLGAPLTGHTNWVESLAFSRDGHQLASASMDGTVRIWPGPAAWPALLCDKLNANMSRQQWRDWVASDIGYIQLCPNLPVSPDHPG
jgi:WD40 repeat protein